MLTDAEWDAAVAEHLELKGERHVRTPEGARLFKQPIGSVIRADVVSADDAVRDWQASYTRSRRIRESLERDTHGRDRSAADAILTLPETAQPTLHRSVIGHADVMIGDVVDFKLVAASPNRNDSLAYAMQAIQHTGTKDKTPVTLYVFDEGTPGRRIAPMETLLSGRFEVTDVVDDDKAYGGWFPLRTVHLRRKDTTNPATAAQTHPLDERVKAFAEDGGEVRVASLDELEGFSAQVDDLVELVPELEDLKGTKFTKFALDEGREMPNYTTVLVAEGDGVGIAGALSIVWQDWQSEDGETQTAALVGYVGSVGTVRGTGAALVKAAARLAAERNLPLIGEPVQGAVPFWESVGWHDVDDPSHMGWTLEETRAAAR